MPNRELVKQHIFMFRKKIDTCRLGYGTSPWPESILQNEGSRADENCDAMLRGLRLQNQNRDSAERLFGQGNSDSSINAINDDHGMRVVGRKPIVDFRCSRSMSSDTAVRIIGQLESNSLRPPKLSSTIRDSADNSFNVDLIPSSVFCKVVIITLVVLILLRKFVHIRTLVISL